MAETTSIQLQSVGDLISESFRICRQNYLLIIKVLLPTLIAIIIARTCLIWGITHLAEGFLQALLIGLAGFCFLVWFSWLVLLRLLTLLNILVMQEQSASTTKLENYEVIYKQIKKRQFAALGIFILTVAAEMFALGVWLVATILVGVLLSTMLGKPLAIALAVLLGLIFLIFGAAILSQFMGVGLAMVSIEQRTFGDYLKESFFLVINDAARAFGFALLLLFSIYLIAIPLSIPITAYSVFIALGHSFSPMSPHAVLSSMPLSGLIFTEIWAGLISLITWSITCISYGVYYKDLTVRRYAIDLAKQVDILMIGKT